MDVPWSDMIVPESGARRVRANGASDTPPSLCGVSMGSPAAPAGHRGTITGADPPPTRR